MKYYRAYMDRQAPGWDLRRRLLAIAETPGRRAGHPWRTAAALAACCVLALALWRPAPSLPAGPLGKERPEGLRRSPLPGGPADASAMERDDERTPGWPDYRQENLYQFLVRGNEGGEALMFPDIQGIDYAALDCPPNGDTARVKIPDGAFDVPLTREQICRILWGGDQDAYHQARENGRDVPWLLGWEGYSVSGRACYDGEGDLYAVYLWGVWAGSEDAWGPGRNFTVTLAPGAVPPGCVAKAGAVTDVRGVAVEGWTYHLDDQYIYECAFLAHGVGTRFTFYTEEEENWTELLFVNWNAYYDGGLSLDHLLRNENIPAWEKTELASLEEARERPEFAPCLPREAPAGFDFYGVVDYQEGVRNTLFLRWSRGEAEVTVLVERPEGAMPDRPGLFPAEEWSFAALEAHGLLENGHRRVYFELLYPGGVAVTWDCTGVTARELWDLLESALP